jgi:hypothetical protein
MPDDFRELHELETDYNDIERTFNMLRAYHSMELTPQNTMELIRGLENLGNRCIEWLEFLQSSEVRQFYPVVNKHKIEEIYEWSGLAHSRRIREAQTNARSRATPDKRSRGDYESGGLFSSLPDLHLFGSAGPHGQYEEDEPRVHRSQQDLRYDAYRTLLAILKNDYLTIRQLAMMLRSLKMKCEQWLSTISRVVAECGSLLGPLLGPLTSDWALDNEGVRAEERVEFVRNWCTRVLSELQRNLNEHRQMLPDKRSRLDDVS